MEQGRRATERWFVARGVPQLIADYTTERRMDRRAAPFLAGWLALGTLVVWSPGQGRLPLERLALSVVALVLIVGLIGLVVLLRRRRIPRRLTIDLIDIATLGAAPAVVIGLLEGSVLTGLVTATRVMTGIGVIYLVIAFGLLEIGVWALRHLRAQLGQISRLVAGTLPILLILVVFLLFAAELWQAAHTLGGADLAAVIGLFLAVATLLVVTRAREELRQLEAELDPAFVAARLPGTPAERTLPPADGAPPLRGRERANLVVLMLVSQLVQSAFVAGLVVLFLVALGLLAVPASVQETWVGEAVRPMLGFELLGEPRLVSVELLIVAGLLGGMCGLYFTGLALTDAAYRAEFHANVVAEVEQIVAVRAAYHTMPGIRRAGKRRPSPG